MTAASPDARSLIVVAGDPAQLSLALHFTRGQAFADRAVLMLPESLHATFGAGLPLRTLPYASVDDIERAATEHQPDLLLLFSGYLITLNRLLTVKAFDALLNRQRERGCRLATSDPLLGLLPSLTTADVDLSLVAPARPAWERWMIRGLLPLRRRFIDVPALADATHLYPTSLPPGADGVPRAAFHNPDVPRASTPAADQPARWLFTLSAMEAACQELMLGKREFTEILLRMLRCALEAETRPTLIAPQAIVDRLRNALPAVELLAGCPHAELEQRLLEAEYLFTWDPFSFTHLARLINELPVFPVDRGYFARIIRPYYALARDCHFAGWEPGIQGQQLFSTYVLSHLARTQREALRAARQRWHASPAPEVVVAQILNGS